MLDPQNIQITFRPTAKAKSVCADIAFVLEIVFLVRTYAELWVVSCYCSIMFEESYDPICILT